MKCRAALSVLQPSGWVAGRRPLWQTQKTRPLHKSHPLHTWTRWQDCIKTVASFLVSLNTLILQLCSHETSLTQFLQPTLMHRYRERASIRAKALNTHDKAKTSTHARRGAHGSHGSLLSHKMYQCRKCTNQVTCAYWTKEALLNSQIMSVWQMTACSYDGDACECVEMLYGWMRVEKDDFFLTSSLCCLQHLRSWKSHLFNSWGKMWKPGWVFFPSFLISYLNV